VGEARRPGRRGRDPGVGVSKDPVPDDPAPLSVDRERDQAIYVEPGVWMLHP